MLDDSDKAAIAAMISDALGPIGSRLLALEQRPISEVTANDLADVRGSMDTLRSNVTQFIGGMTGALGTPSEVEARNAHVDFVLAKYYGSENDRPPAPPKPADG